MRSRVSKLSIIGYKIQDTRYVLPRPRGAFLWPIIRFENIGKEVKKNMILNKIAGMTVAMAMMLSMNGTALAYGSYQPRFHFTMPSYDISVKNEDTSVKTIATVDAYTGGNTQTGGFLGSMTLGTGGVVGISSIAQSEVNTTILPDCGCNLRGDISIRNEDTHVTTVASVDAVTGDSTQTAGMWTHQTMTTGGVQSIGTQATSLVNYTGFSVSGN